MEQRLKFGNLGQAIRQGACGPNAGRVAEGPSKAEVIVKNASLCDRPSLSCSEVFLVPLVGQGDVNVSIEKGQLGVPGMVANPGDGTLLRKGTEIIICKSSYQPCRALATSGHSNR